MRVEKDMLEGLPFCLMQLWALGVVQIAKCAVAATNIGAMRAVF